MAGEPLIPFPPLFPDEAAQALEVFRELRIVDAVGQPTFGEAARPWVIDFASAIFGAYDRDAGRQAIREFLLLISKKNGKSTIAAGIMLTALVRNWRHSAEFLILAPTIEIANNSFIPARDMVAAHDKLNGKNKGMLHVQEHFRTITHMKTRATLRVLAADDETVGGKKATGILIDEMWQFGKRPRAESMLREAMGGRASRPEGWAIYLSTQSDEPPAGVWRQTLRDFRDIRDGRLVDPKRLGALYEFPASMQADEGYRRPENWRITNPNLGLSVDEEFLADELAKADRAGPASFRNFAAKHLNVEIGLALMSDAWAGAEYWDDAAEDGLSLDALMRRSEVAVIGIDGGGLDDLLGLAVMGRERGTGHWLLWTHAWAHPEVMKRRKSEAPKLRDLESLGDLTIVNALGEDLDGIVEIAGRLLDAGLLPEREAIGLDPMGVTHIRDALLAAGISDEQMVAVSQGWKLTAAICSSARMLAEGAMKHGGQELMQWNVANVKIEPRGNGVIATKQSSGRAKIDAFMAAMDSFDLMSRSPEARGQSIFEREEFWGNGRETEVPEIAAPRRPGSVFERADFWA